MDLKHPGDKCRGLFFFDCGKHESSTQAEGNVQSYLAEEREETASHRRVSRP